MRKRERERNVRKGEARIVKLEICRLTKKRRRKEEKAKGGGGRETPIKRKEKRGRGRNMVGSNPARPSNSGLSVPLCVRTTRQARSCITPYKSRGTRHEYGIFLPRPSPSQLSQTTVPEKEGRGSPPPPQIRNFFYFKTAITLSNLNQMVSSQTERYDKKGSFG